MGDKGDKNAAHPPEGSLVETRCLIKGPKSAIVPFPEPRSGPKSRTGPGALADGGGNKEVHTFPKGISPKVNLIERVMVKLIFAQSAGAVEYTDCFSAEGYPPNECPGYDTKQSDGEVPAMLELWGMQSTPLLPSLPGPLWPGVVAPDRALSMG